MFQIIYIIGKLCIFLFWTLFAKIFYNKDDFFKDLFLRMHKFNLIFVKILQCSSNNNDLWTPENKNLLKMYTDNVPYGDEDIDYDTINELIKDKQIIFNNMNKPIHSGTIALVYDGTYLDNKIIIKIKRKNIEKKLKQDTDEIKNIIFLFKWIPYTNKLQIEDNYNIYCPLLEIQCDFKNEIKNQDRYKKNFKNYKHAKIPNVYHDICNKNTIVMEYIDGINISDIKNEDKNKFMDILGHIIITSIVIHGFYHCDAHAGNLIFIKENNEYIIYLIDFGICGECNTTEMDYFFDIFTSIGKSNHGTATDLFLKNFTDCPTFHKDYNIFYNQIKQLLYDSFDVNKEFSFTEIYNLYKILKPYQISTNISWMKVELAIAAIDSCMKEMKYNGLGLTDILKQKINQLNELENSELLK